MTRLHHLCGCYYYLVAPTPYSIRPKQYLPLLNSEAHTTILSTTSTTIIKQTFTNPSPTDDIKECVYTFPLYDGVSVVRFTCKIGEKILTGFVHEKVKAKKIFDEAVAKGETAGLLEQAPEASDVFSTKLGNIPAGQSIIVEISYIGELKHHETEGIRFTIPTKIAPRYGSGPAATGLVQHEGGISITVDIDMPEGSFIKGVQSPSHPIAVSMGAVSTAAQVDPVMSKASATLSLGSAALDKDFVLIVQSKDVGIPKAFLEIHPTIPNHRAIMATLVPKFSLPPSRPEIVFVADRSGSMAGTSITMLVSAMKVFLKSMPTGVKFNICSFGNYCSFLWPQSKSYTSESLEESMEHIQSFTANMGGTETFNAVKSTIERRFSDLPLEIVLLTDGDIWHQNKLFEYVNQQVASSQGKIRIFPLGIGNGVSHSLIEGLARAGNGFAQAVQSGERLDNCVVRMLRGALSPHIADYTLEVKYEQEDDDFEVIEKVTEGMRVLLAGTEPKETANEAPKPRETISLFDPNVDPEKGDIEMKDAEVELPKIPYPKLLQAPHKIPSLFAFSRTTVYLLMSPETIQRNPTSIVLRAISAHGPLALEIPIKILPQPAQTIHQLAAKKAVQDLEEGRGWIFDAKDQSDVFVKDRFPSLFEDLVKKEAVRLGEKFQVAGKWCSFVAVAANDKEIAAKHELANNSSEEDLIDYSDEEDTINESSAASSKSYSFFNKRVNTGGRGGMAPRRQLASMAARKSAPVVGDPSLFAQTTGYQGDMVPQSSIPPSPPSHLAAYQGSLMTLNQENSRCRVMTRSRAPAPIAQVSQSSDRRAAFAPQQMMRQQQQPPALFGQPSANVATQSSMLGGSPLGSSSQPTAGSVQFSSSALSSPTPGGSPFYGRGAAPPVPVTFNSLASTDTRSSEPSHFGRELAAPPPKLINYITKWASKSSIDKILALIEYQEFEGSWPAGNEEIAAILGFQIPQPPKNGDAKTWITLLVVNFLELKNADEEGTWEMVVEKARDWLIANDDDDLADLEKAALEVVNKN